MLWFCWFRPIWPSLKARFDIRTMSNFHSRLVLSRRYSAFENIFPFLAQLEIQFIVAFQSCLIPVPLQRPVKLRHIGLAGDESWASLYQIEPESTRQSPNATNLRLFKHLFLCRSTFSLTTNLRLFLKYQFIGRFSLLGAFVFTEPRWTDQF